MTAYMKFGDTIKGDATLAAVKDWISISHFEWQIDWAVTTRAGTDGARDAKTPTMGQVTVKKETDNATRYLLDAITRNKFSSAKGETCVIRFLSTGQGDNLFEMIYQEFTLYDALITQIHFGSGGDRAIETMQINFTGIEMKVWPHGLANMSRDNPNRLAAAVVFDRYNKIAGSK